MDKSCRQPWISSAAVDVPFILAPAFVSVGIAWGLADRWKTGPEMPPFAWVVLILLIDVAHVYSTLYRTYLDPQMWRTRRALLINVPLAAFVAGVILYTLSGLFFWRVLAYLAVFHFVRQQYGFLRLYARAEAQPPLLARLDTLVIYTATLYPLLHWHLTAPRHFNWFVDNDFLYFRSAVLLQVSTVLYWAILLAFILKEIYLFRLRRCCNVPRLGILLGTTASWYVGIVHYNGDLVFTLLNVVAHGIPYMALVWIYSRRQLFRNQTTPVLLKNIFATYGLPLFLGILFLLAYLEEGLWDALVWQDHGSIFSPFYSLPSVTDPTVLAWLVPLLALPQATHYILDGFIWRVSRPES